jgi:hypothetical protein
VCVYPYGTKRGENMGDIYRESSGMLLLPFATFVNVATRYITDVASVKRKKPLELSKGELSHSIQESLELGGSLWKAIDWKYRWRSRGE